MQSIRSAIRGLQHWIADLNEKKQLLLDALEKAKGTHIVRPSGGLFQSPQRTAQRLVEYGADKMYRP